MAFESCVLNYSSSFLVQIIEFCKQKLAKFKVPKRVVFTQLPKTSTGKIQKFVLRDRAKKLAAETQSKL